MSARHVAATALLAAGASIEVLAVIGLAALRKIRQHERSQDEGSGAR